MEVASVAAAFARVAAVRAVAAREVAALARATAQETQEGEALALEAVEVAMRWGLDRVG